MSDVVKLKWWRVTLSKDGAVKSCKEVEHAAGPEGLSHVYVQANDTAEACSAAMGWYRERLRAMHVRRRARKLCTHCESPRVAGKGMCEAHLALVTRPKPGQVKPKLTQQEDAVARLARARVIFLRRPVTNYLGWDSWLTELAEALGVKGTGTGRNLRTGAR